MKRTPVILVTAMLCVVAAGFGLVAGRSAQVTETQVIEAGAALYVAETGGARTACVGLPGQTPVWVEVRCGAGEDVRVYRFDRAGARLEHREGSRT